LLLKQTFSFCRFQKLLSTLGIAFQNVCLVTN